MKMSLCSLILLIALNLNVNVYRDHNIYIPLILIVLIIYNFIITRHKADKKYNKLFIYLYAIFSIYLFQLFFKTIYNYPLYVSNLSYFLVILLMIRYFINISKFCYSEEYILKLISIFSLSNSILGILQIASNKTLLMFSGGESVSYAGKATIKRAVGFVGASNGAGNLGAILLPVLLYKFSKNKNIYNFFVVVLNILFTILTFTRIAYVAIIIELIIFFIFGLRSKNLFDKIAKSFSTVILVPLFIFIYSKFFNSIYYYTISSRGNTQEHRFSQFDFILNQFVNYPILGVGSGQYTDYYLNNFGRYDLSVHSQYMNILIEQGIISFLSFLFFNIYILKILMHKFDKSYRWFFLSIFIGNIIVINFNPNQYYSLNIYLYYFILFAFMFCSKGKEYKQND